MKSFLTLLKKDITLEWRQKYAIGGIFLYVFSTVFIVYLSFQNIKAPVWNCLFWIITLFASVNAVAKSFVQESGKRQLYYYTLANPIAILLAKVLYNAGLLFLLTTLAYATMAMIMGNPIVNPTIFWIAILLSSLGLSVTLTFVSAIAAKANNSGTLMAILSFPTIIPILLELIKITLIAIGFTNDTGVWRDIVILLSLDLILLSLTALLFPLLWKD